MTKVKVIPESETRNKYLINCPGCDEQHALSDGWAFNVDLEKPTFDPSLLVKGGRPRNGGNELFTCHSYIIDGKIRFLSDCRHKLANQTVDLIDF